MDANALHRTAWLALLLVAACSGEAPTGSSGMASAVGEEALQTLPTGKSGVRGATNGFVPFVWYDGTRECTAWMDPDRLADHAPDAASRARLAALDPSASASEPVEGSPRLWRLGLTAGDPRSLLAVAGTKGPGRFSPLFREHPSESSPVRSLPGGVVLGFEAGWSPERARAWIAGRGLEIVREIELPAPTFVVASPPGLAALELANELRAAPELRLVHPDWWVAAAPY